MSDPGGGEFVEAGGFKVDRAKALEKLKVFSSPDPNRFILFLARCAVLSGSPFLRAEPVPEDPEDGSGDASGVRVSFGGEPLGRAALADPFASLFVDAGAGARRELHLARALLDLSGAGLQELSLSSGRGAERRTLRVDAAGRESLSSGPAGEDTVLQASWKPASELRFGRMLGLLRASCAEAPLEISARGQEPFPRPAPGPDELAFADGERRGRIRAAAGLLHGPGRLSVYQAGVLVEDLPAREAGWPPVEGFVDDPAVRLTFSGTALARGERFGSMLGCVNGQARRLLSAALAEQERSVPELGAMLAGLASRRLWGVVLEGKVDSEPEPSGSARLYRHAVRTLWLRLCGLELEDPQADRADALKKSLWDAPLYLSTEGKAVSLLDVERERGRLRASRTYGSAGSGSWALWLDSSKTLSSLPSRLREGLRR